MEKMSKSSTTSMANSEVKSMIVPRQVRNHENKNVYRKQLADQPDSNISCCCASHDIGCRKSSGPG